MDKLLKGVLEAPDYVAFVQRLADAPPEHPTYNLARMFCHLLDQFKLYRAEKGRRAISESCKSGFRDAWLTYKRQIRLQAEVYDSKDFQLLRTKALAELGFNENTWAELESAVPPYDVADGRDPLRLRNRITP